MKLIAFLILAVCTLSCVREDSVSAGFGAVNPSNSKNTIPFSQIEGSWTCTKFVKGAAGEVDPCSPTKLVNPITLDVKVDGQSFDFSGRSTVNFYNSKMKIIRYDEVTNTGSCTFDVWSTTKIAGIPEMTTCEAEFYELKQGWNTFKLSRNAQGKLTMRLSSELKLSGISAGSAPSYVFGVDFIKK